MSLAETLTFTVNSLDKMIKILFSILVSGHAVASMNQTCGISLCPDRWEKKEVKDWVRANFEWGGWEGSNGVVETQAVTLMQNNKAIIGVLLVSGLFSWVCVLPLADR